jgi:hypothetical protein
MKGSIYAIFVLLLSTTYCAAQQRESRFSAEILFGASMPVGTFGSKAANGLYAENKPEASGLAKAGPSIQLDISYLVRRSFGISFLIGGQQNKQDNGAFQNDIRESLNTTDHFVVTTNSWQILRMMAGCFYNVTFVGNKLSFRPKVLVGLLKTSIPAYKFYDTTSFAYSANMNKISLPWSVCYDFGAALQWHFAKKIYVSADFDFYYGAPKGFTVTAPYFDQYQNTKIPIPCINAMAGIGYRF